MSSYKASMAPFSQAVVAAMRELYPEEFADKSWDNTGLLLETPWNPARRRPQRNSALLTIDLTTAVADEAIGRQDSIVVAYHPIIFRGLKSLTLEDTQQRSLLRLAAEGISVYCPHTAVDVVGGGLCDWLADIVTAEADDGSSTKGGQKAGAEAALEFFQSRMDVHGTGLKLASIPHERKPITPKNHKADPDAGLGRIVTFERPQQLADIVKSIRTGLGGPRAFPIAIPQNRPFESITISTVGICAGSGGSMFKDLEADLLFTGELSHHEALAAIEKGQSVISLFHSNTERGYLHSVMRMKLEEQVKKEWESVREDRRREAEKDGGEGKEELLKALEDENFEIAVSERDRDPYGIYIS